MALSRLALWLVGDEPLLPNYNFAITSQSARIALHTSWRNLQLREKSVFLFTFSRKINSESRNRIVGERKPEIVDKRAASDSRVLFLVLAKTDPPS
jgi:hypothetical protein